MPYLANNIYYKLALVPLFYKRTPTRSLQKPKILNPSLSSNFIYKMGIAFKSLNTIIYRVKLVAKWEILISILCFNYRYISYFSYCL